MDHRPKKWVAGGILRDGAAYKPSTASSSTRTASSNSSDSKKTAAELYDEVLAAAPVTAANADHPKKRRRLTSAEADKKKGSGAVPKPFWCDECGRTVENATLAQHVRSTAHLVELKKPPALLPYRLTSENVGFRLLRNSGWQVEEGLGPTGEGRKEPVPTVLKRDRTGVGAGKSRSAVTHTQEELEKHQMTLRSAKDRPAAPTLYDRVNELAREDRWRRRVLYYMNN